VERIHCNRSHSLANVGPLDVELWMLKLGTLDAEGVLIHCVQSARWSDSMKGNADGPPNSFCAVSTPVGP
jgi:hypothetical protein